MKTRACTVTMIVSLVLLQPTPGAAQDTLSRARTLYASADYEQALAVLENAPGARETHYYRALCLIALGRSDAADEQIEAVVSLDPMFVPPAGEVSPRVTATFAETRSRLLPGIARTTFTEARRLFQAGEHDRARARFELTLKMLDDSALDEGNDLADLRLVASGFLDLARIESEPPPAPEPEPVAALPPAASAAEPAPPAGGVATVPITIEQELPPWRPEAANARRVFTGAVRVEIDEAGRVTDARMERPAHPSYDHLLLTAARRWRYVPATLNGVPMASEKTVEIVLQPR